MSRNFRLKYPQILRNFDENLLNQRIVMRIQVTFPSMMKMECREVIEVSTPLSLEELKLKIIEHFQQNFMRGSPFNWKPDQVRLIDQHRIEVMNQADLQARIEEAAQFTVIFSNLH